MSEPKKNEVSTEKDKKSQVASYGSGRSLMGLRRDIDSLFEDFFSSFPFGPFGRGRGGFHPFERMSTALEPMRGFMPNMDVSETDDEFRVSAELPGMDENDIELSLSEGQLIIKGEKKEEKTSDEEGHYLRERHFGSVYRSMPLPDNVDEESIKATYEKGVLSVTLKKTESEKKESKRIEINSK